MKGKGWTWKYENYWKEERKKGYVEKEEKLVTKGTQDHRIGEENKKGEK